VDKAQQEVLSILMMRFGLDPYGAIPIGRKWLERNPNENWQSLKDQLIKGEVTFKQGKLKTIKAAEIATLVDRMRDENIGIEIKNRWSNFRRYRNTFIGSEAIEWLMRMERICRKEAVLLGQILIDRGIINNLNDDRAFNNGESLYRFYQDEKDAVAGDIELQEISIDRGFDWGDVLTIK